MSVCVCVCVKCRPKRDIRLCELVIKGQEMRGQRRTNNLFIRMRKWECLSAGERALVEETVSLSRSLGKAES